MKRGIFPAYLGDIATEALLQNLTSQNREFFSVEDFREAFPLGFEVMAHVELSVPETPGERQPLIESAQAKIASARTDEEMRQAMRHPGDKLIGLVLTPK